MSLKKNVTNVTFGGGRGSRRQNVKFLQVVFKIHVKPFMSSHSNFGNGGTPILSHYSPILAIKKIFTSVLTFLGGQKNFFGQKCHKSGLVSLKKYIVYFVKLRGGEVNPDVTFVTFFFFLKASLKSCKEWD